MNTPQLSSRSFFQSLVWTLFLLSAAAIAALGLETLDDLLPGAFLSRHLRGQLHSFAHLTLLHFVLLPGLPALILHSRKRKAGLCMTLAGPLWGLGALLLAGAALTGGLEAGWAFAFASPLTRGLVSVLQLLALLFATLATELLVLDLLAVSGSPLSRDFRVAAPAIASRILALALPVQASVLLLGLLERITGMELIATLSAPLLPALLTAWSWTPLAMGLMLLAASLCADILAPSTPLPCGPFPLMLGALSLCTLQLSLLPATLPSFVVISAIGLHCLLAAAAWALGFRLLPALFARGLPRSPARVLAAAALAFLAFLPPLHLWTNLLDVNTGFPFSPWVTATHSALVLAAGLALLAPLSPNTPLRLPLRLSIGTVAGAALLFLSLLLQAGRFLPCDIPVPDAPSISGLLLLGGGLALICLAGLAPGWRRS